VLLNIDMGVLIIIAQKDFRDEEFFEPKEILEKNGIEVKVASKELAMAYGKMGGEFMPDLKLEDAKAEDFDAIIFVGGIGAEMYLDDLVAHRLANDFYGAGKIVAAICFAPLILAHAGILNGKKVTVWIGGKEDLEAYGAVYTGKAVEVDSNIITGSGPAVAKEFGEKIIEVLLKK